MKYSSFSLAALVAVLGYAPLAGAQPPATSAAATSGAATAAQASAAAPVPILPSAAEPVPPAGATAAAPESAAAPVAVVAPSPRALTPTYPWAKRQRATEPLDTRPLAPLKQLFSLHVGADTLWNKDAGYDLFSSNDLAQRIGLLLEAELVDLDPRTHVDAQVGLAWEATSDGSVPSHIGSGASLKATHPSLGLLLGHNLFDWLALHGRVQAGYSFTDLRIERFDTLNSSGDFKSSTSQPFAALGAGATVSTHALRVSKHNTYFNALSCGIRAEGGYLFTKAIHASFPNVPAAPPEQQIATRSADLGELNRKGVYLYLGAFLKI